MLQFVVHVFQNQKVCYNMVCMFYKTEKYAQWVGGLLEGFLRWAKSQGFV
jgi:hypothetical protein